MKLWTNIYFELYNNYTLSNRMPKRQRWEKDRKLMRRPGLNFINVLRTAFTLVYPRRVKRHWWLYCFFTLLGSTSTKAVPRKFMKLTPEGRDHDESGSWRNDWNHFSQSWLRRIQGSRSKQSSRKLSTFCKRFSKLKNS